MDNYEFLKSEGAKIQSSLSLIIKIFLVFSIGYFFYSGSWRILFINLLLLILVFIPALSRKVNVEVPREMEFVLLVFVILSFFLGEIRGWVIQVFFGLAMGFIGFALMIILYKNSRLRPNYFLIMIYSLSISLTLGTLTELSKFYLKIFLSHDLRIADYTYAMTSLSLVFIGALIASMFAFVYMSGVRFMLMDNLVNRFKKKNPNLFIERTDSPEEILSLIKKGENERLEFKSTLRTNLHTNEIDRRIEQSVLKTISAFLNTSGGVLLIGVSDSGSIVGIERDHFINNDKFSLHFTNLIKDHIGNQNLHYLNFELVLIEGKNILKVNCLKSDKPVFLTFNKSEEFFMRAGAATIQLIGSKLVGYINNHFK